MANEFVKGKKFNFTAEVDYSEGGIISKNVLKRPTGNLSLFSFDKGESLSTHTAPFDAIIQVLEGKARVTIGGEPNELTGGESIIMPANIPHGVEAIERFKMVLIMIKE